MPEPGYDVLIIGGGVIGSSIAYFLSAASTSKELRVCVVEPDPTYARSSTALSVGRARVSSMGCMSSSFWSVSTHR